MVGKETEKTWESGTAYLTTSVFTHSFEHDAQGYLTKWDASVERLSGSPGAVPEIYISRDEYTYSNGNMISMLQYDQVHDTYDYCAIESYLDKKNVLPTSETAVNMFIKPDKNLPKKASYSSTPGGEEYVSWTYTYDFNTEGFITKMIASYAEAGIFLMAEEFTYEYNCE